jgi:hypothetical protein
LVKIAVLKSAVDGTKKCGRGTQKKSYPEFRTSFDIHWLNASEIKIIYLGKTIKES